jgi:exodeoxyribonuclease VII small subunit
MKEHPQHTESPSFEQCLAELEAIVHDLEDGQLGLAEALARYEQGVKHLKHCFALLKSAEQKIELLTDVTENGAAVTQPFVIDQEAPARPGARRRAKPKPPETAPETTRDEPFRLGRDIDD